MLQELEEKQGNTESEVTAGLKSDKSTLEPEEEGFREAISVALQSRLGQDHRAAAPLPSPQSAKSC